jgi:hypothetical protein
MLYKESTFYKFDKKMKDLQVMLEKNGVNVEIE